MKCEIAISLQGKQTWQFPLPESGPTIKALAQIHVYVYGYTYIRIYLYTYIHSTDILIYTGAAGRAHSALHPHSALGQLAHTHSYCPKPADLKNPISAFAN